MVFFLLILVAAYTNNMRNFAPRNHLNKKVGYDQEDFYPCLLDAYDAEHGCDCKDARGLLQFIGVR